jgi:hypothetical protein
MTKIAGLLVALSIFTTACVVHERRNCREHETWDGGSCHADRGYEHYWDHPDHRDWHGDDHH